MPQTTSLIEITTPEARELNAWETIFPPNDGIFRSIFTRHSYVFPSWVGITYQELDQLAWGQFGYRRVSILVEKYKKKYPNDWKDYLADAIWAMFHVKWDKYIDLAELEYDPIHNFSDTIHEEITGTEDEDTTTNIDRSIVKTGTQSSTSSRLRNVSDTDEIAAEDENSITGSKELSGTSANTGTVSNVRTDNLHEQRGDNTSVSNQDSRTQNLYGFNSTNPVGDSTNGGTASSNGVESHSVDNTGTRTDVRTDDTLRTDGSEESTSTAETKSHSETKEKTLSETGSGTDSTTLSSTQTDNDDRSSVRDLDTTRVRDLERSGNVGNLTTQELIRQEIALWRWKFIQDILDDVKDFATLPIYC